MRPRTVIGVVIALAFAYATVRYNVFGDVPWRQFPVYVANKAAALASLALLGLSLVTRDRVNRRTIGAAGCTLLAAHAGASVLILTPAYFDKYFHADRTLTANAEAALAFGIVSAILAAVLFFTVQNNGNGRSLRRGAGRVVLITAAAHTALLGYPTWMKVGEWPAYLPPITLLATVVAIAFLAIRSLNGTSKT
jgi:hypothetical protein